MTTPTNDTLAHWRDHMPPIGAKPHPCPFCGHLYIMPCTDEQHAACQNFTHQHKPRINTLIEDQSHVHHHD